jgi:hypothetical protein
VRAPCRRAPADLPRRPLLHGTAAVAELPRQRAAQGCSLPRSPPSEREGPGRGPA